MKPRVLLVNRAGFIGGVERVLLTLAHGLPPLGWHPILACPAEGDLAEAARQAGIEVAPCRFDRMRITADPRVLASYPLAWHHGSADIERHCREREIGLIHVQHPVSALYAARAASRLGLAMIVHVHETAPARPLYALAGRAAFRRAASTLCVSGAARDLALSLNADPARCVVVHNGVDHGFMASPQRKPPQAVIDAGPGPHVGVFGVFEPRKAQHVLIEAAMLLASHFPDARFWLVGKAALRDKQAYADRLQSLAGAPALRGRIMFPGFDPDIIPWIQAMDVVVQPSVALESFGMALAEAMALGRPVVASRVGGMPEVVGDASAGLIVPPSDPAALAEALGQLLSNPGLRAKLGTSAAARVKELFSPEVFCAGVVRSYAASMRPLASINAW